MICIDSKISFTEVAIHSELDEEIDEQEGRQEDSHTYPNQLSTNLQVIPGSSNDSSDISTSISISNILIFM